MNEVENRVGEVVMRAVEGDQDAVEALYRLYHHRLVNVAHRRLGQTLNGLMESVDLVQSVWRDVLRAIDQFEDRGPDSFFRWLHTCLIHKVDAKRRFHNADRRRAKRSFSWPDGDLIPQQSDRTPSQNAVTHEEVERLMHALDRFPETQRDVLLMRMRDGLTHEEISRKIGKSLEATKKIYQRSLPRLVAMLPKPEL